MGNVKYTYFLIEQVRTNSNQRLAYSLPDYISDINDVRELINTIEANPELKLLVLGDATRKSFVKATAKDVWFHLDTTPIGKRLIKDYPDIVNFRISSVSTAGDPELYEDPSEGVSDLYTYDKWGNSHGIKIKQGAMPSFREYFSDTAKWNAHTVAGASLKDRVF